MTSLNYKMAACAGSLSENEFKEFAEIFSVNQKKIGNDWEIKICNLKNNISDMYVVSRKVFIVSNGSWTEGTSNTAVGPTETSEYCNVTMGGNLVEFEDPATLQDEFPSNTISYVYHIVYSHTYQVPVLYFSCCHSNGQLLSIEEVWSHIPPVHQQRVSHNSWSLITQGDHPILGQPFFYVHPCHTSDVMRCVWSKGSQIDYLTSWLSMFGPLVGVDLPLPLSTLDDSDNTNS